MSEWKPGTALPALMKPLKGASTSTIERRKSLTMLTDSVAVVRGEVLPSLSALDTDLQTILAAEVRHLKAKVQEGPLSKEDLVALEVCDKVRNRLSEREKEQRKLDSGKNLAALSDEEVREMATKALALLPESKALNDTKAYENDGRTGGVPRRGAPSTGGAVLTSYETKIESTPEIYVKPENQHATSVDDIPPDEGERANDNGESP